LTKAKQQVDVSRRGVNKLPKHSASGVTFAHRENWISCLSSHQLFKDSAAEATQTSQLAVLAVLPQVVVMAISLDPSEYNTVPHFRRKATQARLISNDQFGQNISLPNVREDCGLNLFFRFGEGNTLICYPQTCKEVGHAVWDVHHYQL
jgi:hypothetical protein